MSRVCCRITMKLLSDAIFHSGYSVPGGEDFALRLDEQGLPLVPAATVKGLLRQSVQNYLCWTGHPDGRLMTDLFGRPGRRIGALHRLLVFDDLKPERLPKEESEWSSIRAFVSMEDGAPKNRALRTAACLHKGIVFSGVLLCDEKDQPMLTQAIKGIQWVGLMRHKGFGHVAVRLEPGQPLVPFAPLGPTSVIHYRLRLKTPLLISWLNRSGISASNNRDYTQGKDYLPGSAVRGMVLSQLSWQDRDWFEAHKEELMTKVRFPDAFPMDQGQSLMPTPAGFYEDKARTHFYSVLNRDVEPGDKRAQLGNYCAVTDEGLLRDFSPVMTTQLRMDRYSKRTFTVRAIGADTVLEGYIYLDDPALGEKIAGVFLPWLWLGADRHAGNGLCQVTCLDTKLPQLDRYSYAPGDSIPRTLYMMLLSPTTMTRYGEPVGIDEGQLAAALGVGSVKILRCATAFTESSGFNRFVGCAEPGMTMYEKGSMFCLECDRPPEWEALRRLECDGIGIRRQEGYGQVLFLKNFTDIHRREEKQLSEFVQSDESRYRHARCRWLLNPYPRLPLGLPANQMMNIQGLFRGILLGERTEEELLLYLADKEGKGGKSREKEAFRRFHRAIDTILTTPLEDTLQCRGYPDPADKSERYRLILDWMLTLRKEERT